VHHPAVLINHHDLARDSSLDEVADLAAQTLAQDSSAVRQSLHQTFCFISEAPIPAAAGPAICSRDNAYLSPAGRGQLRRRGQLTADGDGGAEPPCGARTVINRTISSRSVDDGRPMPGVYP
jgi:hypothetical protein